MRSLQEACHFAYEQEIMQNCTAWIIANSKGGIITPDIPLTMTIHVMNNRKEFDPIPVFTSCNRAPLVRIAGGKPYVTVRVFYRGLENFCDPDDYEQHRDLHKTKDKRPLSDLLTEIIRAPVEDDIAADNILHHICTELEPND